MTGHPDDPRAAAAVTSDRAQLVAEVDDMIWQAVRAGFDYFQREAGYTGPGRITPGCTAGRPASGTKRT